MLKIKCRRCEEHGFNMFDLYVRTVKVEGLGLWTHSLEGLTQSNQCTQESMNLCSIFESLLPVEGSRLLLVSPEPHTLDLKRFLPNCKKPLCW